MIGPTTFRIICSSIGLFAMVGYFHQEQLVMELKHHQNSYWVALTNTDRSMLEQEENHEKLNATTLATKKCEEKSETITNTARTATRPLASMIELPPVIISTNSPLFVLSLPNHYDLALPRYFDCAGYDDSKTLGRHWTNPPVPGKRRGVNRWEIGRFMRGNMQRNKPLLHGCCDQFQVFMDLQYLLPPEYRDGGKQSQEECFDPVMFPGALEALNQQYQLGATILNVVQDPVEWFQTLPPQLPQFWNEWCNPTHNDTFPNAQEIGHQRPMIGFYLEYQQRLKQFARDHPHWNYIEIDLQQQQSKPDIIALQLQQQLGIPSQCWMDSTQGNIAFVDTPDPSLPIPNILANQGRPNSIGWPILVTAMPKAGTSTIHDYFMCGLGDRFSAHQWTTRSKPPHTLMAVGECMINNTDLDLYPFLDGCGNQLVWSDTGVLRQQSKYQNRTCYFPFLHRQGLERWYQSYPYGTILNVIRNTTSWVSSAFRWRDLPERWVMAQCEGFPTQRGAPKEEWEAWYNNVQETVRQFARDHPTMTYMEIPLNDYTSDILHDVFSFPKECWGHANVNRKNPEAAATNETSTS